jgi:hypothetical protein
LIILEKRPLDHCEANVGILPVHNLLLCQLQLGTVDKIGYEKNLIVIIPYNPFAASQIMV